MKPSISIRDVVKERILVLDGAMGTMIQRHKFSEEDFRGRRFADLYKTFQDYLIAHYESGSGKKYIPKQFPINRIYYLPGNERIYFQHIRKERGERIEGMNLILDKTAYPSFHKNDLFFFTPDNQVLQKHSIALHGSPFYLFQNISDLNKLHDLYAIFKKTDRVDMCGRNPFGLDFPKQVDQLIEKLPDVLRASNKFKENFLKGNYTLSKIEQLLYAQIISDDFIDQVFLPLYAFLGKHNIKNSDYEWTMEYDKHLDIWIPDLADEDGPIAFYKIFLKILNSTNERWEPLNVFLQK